jgi:hypothetical protein
LKQSLITALALVASAVFLAQAIRPAGMLAAMFQYESGLLDPDETRHLGGPANRPTWKTIYTELETALAEHPATPGRNAVSFLLRTLIKADRGKLKPDELARAKQAVEIDTDNLLSRVAYAVIVDSQSGGTDPTARYKAIQEIIERPPQPKKATLYINDFTRKWEEILRPHFQRRDLSVRLAASMEHYEVEDHYEAFPFIRKHLFDLAGAMPRAKMPRDKDHCSYWFDQLMIQMMHEEKEAGTLLFCADQVIRWDRILHVSAWSLAEMRRDFHAHAVQSPVDVLELWRTPAIDGSAFRWALGTLGFAGALFACALGAAGVMMVALVFGLIRAATVRESSRDAGAPGPLPYGRGSDQAQPGAIGRIVRWMRAIARMAMPIIAMSAIVGWLLAKNGPFSPAYELVLAVACITIGAIVAAWVAASRPSAIGLGCTFILFVGTMLVALSSPASIVWQCRRIDMVVPSELVIFALVACFVVVASIASPLDWRAVGRQATTAFAVNACAAFIMLQFHEAADQRFQDSVIAHRLDELPARLGDDWENKYLVETKIADALQEP